MRKPSISHAAARAVASRALAEAAAMGLRICVAVVDESGLLTTADRMDGADFVAIASAQDKAYTAAGFTMPTLALHERMTDDPALLASVAASDRIMAIGGGVPIRVGGVVVGAVGVGGGRQQQDHDIAARAATSLGEELRDD